MAEFYVDIETTDTAHTAGIWDIGVVITKSDGTTEGFTTMCVPSGTESAATKAWIAGKPNVALNFEEALASARSEAEALTLLSEWIAKHMEEGGRGANVFYSWGNFDFTILDEAARRNGVDMPWHYGDVVDMRSVARFFGLSSRPDTSTHEALGDAQALRVCHNSILIELGDMLNG